MGKIRRRPVPEIEVEAEDLAADLFFSSPSETTV